MLREGVCTRREVTVLDAQRLQGQGDALPPTPAKPKPKSPTGLFVAGNYL